MTTLIPHEPDLLLKSDFIREIVKQMRALDSHGVQDNWSIERILAPLVMSKEQRRRIPIIGDLDAKALAHLQAFYNALASLIENRCGLRAVPTISLTQEGFGRAIITVGRLVVADKALRDVHRFGFESLSKMKDEAEQLLSTTLDMIHRYPEIASL